MSRDHKLDHSTSSLENEEETKTEFQNEELEKIKIRFLNLCKSGDYEKAKNCIETNSKPGESRRDNTLIQSIAYSDYVTDSAQHYAAQNLHQNTQAINSGGSGGFTAEALKFFTYLKKNGANMSAKNYDSKTAEDIALEAVFTTYQFSTSTTKISLVINILEAASQQESQTCRQNLIKKTNEKLTKLRQDLGWKKYAPISVVKIFSNTPSLEVVQQKKRVKYLEKLVKAASPEPPKSFLQQLCSCFGFGEAEDEPVVEKLESNKMSGTFYENQTSDDQEIKDNKQQNKEPNTNPKPTFSPSQPSSSSFLEGFKEPFGKLFGEERG